MEAEIRAALERNEVTGSTNKNFGLVMSAFFFILSILPTWKRLDPPNWFMLAVSFCFFAFAFLLPSALAPLNKAWTKLGLIMQKVMSPLILGLIFYGIFTPLGLLMRATSHDPLARTFDQKTNSYWKQRDKSRDVGSAMMDQF